MWLLNFLPVYFFHILTIVGFIGVLACLFPIPHKTIVQVLSIAIVSFSLYMEGGISNQAEWELKVKEAEAKAAQKETAAAEVTVKVVTKYVKQIQVVKETGDVIIKEIPTYITKVDDAKCTVPNGFVLLHNSASRNEVPDTTRPVDAGASEVKISGVAETVVTNYNTYYQVSEQLKALQAWVREQQLNSNK
jgi:hypothetical protein